jgi:RNA polymerase sigma-70 factor (ECF subfamily)
MADSDTERERRFLDLIEANRARLVRIARAYGGGDAWRDLHQEILLQVWKGLPRFEQRSSASTWLFRVAVNTGLTWRRRSGSTGREVVADAGSFPDPGGDANPRDPLRILDEFLQSVNGIDRAILLLYLEDTSYADIADVTGLTENHVGVRISRLKRAFIERYIGD